MKSWVVWLIIIVVVLFIYHYWVSDNTKASALP
jgi:hypothetical protein